MTRISINLLGIDRKEALQRSGLNIDKGLAIATTSIIIALLLLFGSNALVSSWVASAEELKEENTLKIAALDKQIEEIKSLEKEKADKEMEEKILRYVTGETYRWSYLLQEVRLLMPVDIKIDQLSFNPQGEFSLQGSATDHRSVAMFLANLKNSKMLQDIQLQSSEKPSAEEPTVFSITCKLKVGS